MYSTSPQKTMPTMVGHDTIEWIGLKKCTHLGKEGIPLQLSSVKLLYEDIYPL